MQALFPTILKMSATTSVVILVILLARLILTHAPKKYSYFLWAVVGFRMCCPIGFKSRFSLFRLMMPRITYLEAPNPQATVLGEYPAYSLPVSQTESAVPALMQPQTAVQAASAVGMTDAGSGVNWLAVCTAVWLTGVVILISYSIVQEIRMRRRLVTATRLRGNIYQSENVASPFLMGVLRPKIYLPYHLPFRVQSYVIAHERYHMHRLDHIARRVAFVLLTLHWFNPLCWLGFYLMGKDMELSCDEGVLNNMRVSVQDYSSTLLAFATNHRFLAVSPLAFGETGVKSRIVNALRWKKPHPSRTLAGFILSAAVIAACVTDPLAADEYRLITEPENTWADQPLNCRRVELMMQNDGREELSFYNENGDLVQWLNTYPEENDTCFVLEGKRYLWDDAHNCLDSADLNTEDFSSTYNYVEQESPQRIDLYDGKTKQFAGSYRFEYNDQKQLIRKVGLYADGVRHTEWQYHYQKNGLCDTQKFRYYNEKGELERWEDTVYGYTPGGRILYQCITFEDQEVEYFWDYYVTDSNEPRIQESEWINGKLIYQKCQDEDGRTFWEEMYEENSRLSSVVRNEYNQEKQLVRQTESDENGTIRSINIFEYGTDNRVSKTTKYASANCLEIREYKSFPRWSVPVREIYYEDGVPVCEIQRECYEDGNTKSSTRQERGVVVEECHYNRQGQETEIWMWDEEGRETLHEKCGVEEDISKTEELVLNRS